MRQPYHEDQVYERIPALAPGEYDNCTFSHCVFANADFTGYVFSDCTFEDCDLTNLKLHEAALKTVTFERCKLLGLRFEDCRDFLFQVAFTDCNLELSTFTDWKLK
ncbi:MAG: pentapeptide repeat-containing protein, partial [Lewinella sp.]